MYKSTVKTPLVVSITIDMFIPKVILLTHHGETKCPDSFDKKKLCQLAKKSFFGNVYLWFICFSLVCLCSEHILKLAFLETSYLPD